MYDRAACALALERYHGFPWRCHGLVSTVAPWPRDVVEDGYRKPRGPLSAESDRMTAALAYRLFDVPADAPASVPTLIVPAELQALFAESPRMKLSFSRLTERDRRGFVSYIEETRSVMTRERRAAVVAMSLMGLARDLCEGASSES